MKSKWEPHQTFEEWTLDYQKKKHGATFYERADRVLDFLQKNAKKYPGQKFCAQEIADRYNKKFDTSLSFNTIQTTTRYLRHEGHPICTDSSGIWYSDHPNDIQATLNHLYDRIYAIQYTIEKLKDKK